MIEQLYTPNPDAESVNNKQKININYVASDLSSSVYDYTKLVKLNYLETELVVYNDSGSVNEPGHLYYTPLYTEKISYEQWKTRINKSFQELGNR